jgi:hypothetical protein
MYTKMAFDKAQGGPIRSRGGSPKASSRGAREQLRLSSTIPRQELVASQGGREKFRFKNKLMSLDGSINEVSVSIFDWAKYRSTKGAIKVHLLLDHDGYLPSFAVVTEGRRSEIKVARTLRFAPGTILSIDRGYNDYEWFRELTTEEVYFVTRMKVKSVYEVKEKVPVPQNSNVVRPDHLFSLAGTRVLFRRVEVWDQEKQESIVFLSNLLAFGHDNCGHLSSVPIQKSADKSRYCGQDLVGCFGPV